MQRQTSYVILHLCLRGTHNLVKTLRRKKERDPRTVSELRELLDSGELGKASEKTLGLKGREGHSSWEKLPR